MTVYGHIRSMYTVFQSKEKLHLLFVPVDDNIFSVHLTEIHAKQAKERDRRRKIKTDPSHFQKTMIEQEKIVTLKNRIYIPTDLRTRKIKCHHLCHPGEARMHKILASTLWADDGK